MARKTKEAPPGVRPFICHGVELSPQLGSKANWVGDCFNCGKEKHLFVSPKKGQGDCKVCGWEGNAITFMTQLQQLLAEETTDEELAQFGEDRGRVKIGRKKYQATIPVEILKSFGVALNRVTGEWLVPCISERGTVRDLRRRMKDGNVRSTWGANLFLGGADRVNASTRSTVWICEGEWDAIALAWLLKEAGADGVVCWVPGASSFKPDWVEYFKNRDVIAVYDADDAGDRAAGKLVEKMGTAPASLRFVAWPDSKPKGYDLRDYVVRCMSTNKNPQATLAELKELVRDQPRRSVASGPVEEADEGPPATFEEVVEVFKRHVLVNADFREALKVSLAVCYSNDLDADPLWLYLVGPPGIGKTLICNSLGSSPRCKIVSTVSPHALVSGWKEDGVDPSLIPQLRGKTLVVKDFTEILSMPESIQDEIFSTLRGAYDGYVFKPFGNNVVREYKNCHFSILAGVTNAVHGSSRASLGERFVKFQMIPPINKGADDLIMAAISSVGTEKFMEEEVQTIVRRFLRRKISKMPEVPRWFVVKLTALVQLIAQLRAQVSRDYRGEEVMYRPAPELGTRLAKQLVKLGMMLAAVDDRKEVNDEDFVTIQRVAHNTASEFHLDIIGAMMQLGGRATRQQVAEATEIPSTTLSRRMEDLGVLKLISKTGESHTGRGRPAYIWEVSEYTQKLWKRSEKEAEVDVATRPRKVRRPARRRAQ